MPDAELSEDAREMPLDRAVGEEERRGDLAVRLALGDERRDAFLGRRERARGRGAAADPLQLGACALGPERGADPLEDRERLLERRRAPRAAASCGAAPRRARAACGRGRAGARPSRATRAPPRTPRARHRGLRPAPRAALGSAAQLASADARSSRRALPSYQSSSSAASSRRPSSTSASTWSTTKRMAPGSTMASRRTKSSAAPEHAITRLRGPELRARGGRAQPRPTSSDVPAPPGSRARDATGGVLRLLDPAQLSVSEALESEVVRGEQRLPRLLGGVLALARRARAPRRDLRAHTRPRRGGTGGTVASSRRRSRRRCRSSSTKRRPWHARTRRSRPSTPPRRGEAGRGPAGRSQPSAAPAPPSPSRWQPDPPSNVSTPSFEMRTSPSSASSPSSRASTSADVRVPKAHHRAARSA